MKKELTKAVPTVDADGNVTKWELEFVYSKEEYVVTFTPIITAKDTKKPTKYSKKELLELAKEDHWDAVFISMYETTHTQEKTLERIDDFNLKSLS